MSSRPCYKDVMVSIWKEPEAGPAPSIIPYFSPAPPPLYPEIVLPPVVPSPGPAPGPAPSAPASAPANVWETENAWMRERVRAHRAWMCVSSPYLTFSSDLVTGTFLFELAFLFTFFPFLFYAADSACPRSSFFIQTVFTSFFSFGAGLFSAWTYIRSIRHTSALKATRDIEAPATHYKSQERGFRVVDALRGMMLFFWGLTQSMAIAALVSWYHTGTGLTDECTRHVEAQFMLAGTFLALLTPALAGCMRVVSVYLAFRKVEKMIG